ncbi:hypothetical protein [uncultured Clostridium sp.]|uniref:hypothetical protein n=1 Tax=uncultured Clostridium sp. TaxID=59620 RepID=UPI00263153C3|nr:hypothetical protein [uncultured Clostridium sp.]
MLYSIPSFNLPKNVPSAPDQFYKIPIKGRFFKDEIGEYGESIVIGEFEGLCNYQESAKRVFSMTGVVSKIVGTCEFNYDIFPEYETIYSGEVEILGSTRSISNCTKYRDNNGNVICTRLELE